MGRIIGYYPPFRFTTQLQLVNEEHQSNVGFDMDYAGPDYHLQAKWLAPGSYGMSYFQSITKNWAAGCDLFYNYKQSLTVPTLGTRYVRDKDIFSAVFTYGHLTVSYAYRMSNRVSLHTLPLLLTHVGNLCHRVNISKNSHWMGVYMECWC